MVHEQRTPVCHGCRKHEEGGRLPGSHPVPPAGCQGGAVMSTGFPITYREYWDRQEKLAGSLVQRVRVRVREKYVGGKKVGEEIVETRLEGMAFPKILQSIPLRPGEAELFRAREQAILEGIGLRVAGKEGGWIHTLLPVHVGLDGKQGEVFFRFRADEAKITLEYEATLDHGFNLVIGEAMRYALLASLMAQGQPKPQVPDQGLLLLMPNSGGLPFFGSVDLYLHWPSLCSALGERLAEEYGKEVLYTPKQTEERVGWLGAQLFQGPGQRLGRGLVLKEGLAAMAILAK